MRKIRIEMLNRDLKVYPRLQVDGEHVRAMQSAIRAGVVLPPIVICVKTRKVADGFHRIAAHEAEFGEGFEIECIEKEYASIQELFIDSVRLNGSHGLLLSRMDRAHIIARAQELKVSQSFVASALSVPKTEIQELSVVVSEEMRFEPHPSAQATSVYAKRKQYADIDAGMAPANPRQPGEPESEESFTPEPPPTLRTPSISSLEWYVNDLMKILRDMTHPLKEEDEQLLEQLDSRISELLYGSEISVAP